MFILTVRILGGFGLYKILALTVFRNFNIFKSQVKNENLEILTVVNIHTQIIRKIPWLEQCHF